LSLIFFSLSKGQAEAPPKYGPGELNCDNIEKLADVQLTVMVAVASLLPAMLDARQMNVAAS